MTHASKISTSLVIGGFAACFLAVGADAAAPKASLTRSITVQAPPSAVWSAIGPFCAIREWHPAIGSCALDGKATPTRTLVTRDGQATFVELQVDRNDAAWRYSYSFTSSPAPVTGYVSTLSVRPSGKNASVVTWEGRYTPNAGQERAAESMLSGIYVSGLVAIRDRFAKSPSKPEPDAGGNPGRFVSAPESSTQAR
jgi:hypothetical protein